MSDSEAWGTLLWERRDPFPQRSPSWRIPSYPNASREGGVVYRLRFFQQEQRRSYIGLGGGTVRERIVNHLNDRRENARPQRLMREQLNDGSIDVWTLSRTSTLNVLGLTVQATGGDKFNRLLFKSAAVVYAASRFPDEELLNRPDSLPYGAHRKIRSES